MGGGNPLRRLFRRARDLVKHCVIGCLRVRLRICDRVETSESIAAGMSVSRFGDGEFNLAFFARRIRFQPYDARLAQRLREVLRARVAGLLVCVPGPLKTYAGMEQSSVNYWKRWVWTHGCRVLPALSARRRYGDAGVSRLYLGRADKSQERRIVDNIRSAWRGKDVLVVEGWATRFGVGNDLLDGCRLVRRVLCPAVNAFARYDEIFRVCLQAKAEVYILALGPAATVLAHDLCRAGLVALDLGHMDLQYEYMLRGSEHKHIIEGKYNNEVEGGDRVGECLDAAYQAQILCRIA